MTSRILESGSRPSDDLLTQILHRRANLSAGGQRMDHRAFLPEVDLPDEGTVPEDMIPENQWFDWFDPAVWARATGDDMSMVDMTNVQPATGSGTDGDGMDWFRGGEAPNNLTNRNNPLYQARRDFSIALAPKIEALFGVSAQGSAGYLRPYSASHAAPGGPSANSDHYSGGAVDFFGSPEELTSLRNWLVEQPFTSFVRWQSESHHDHLHVSFDLGWVAQNFFQGRALPPVRKPVSAAASPQRTTEQATRSITGGGVQVA